MSELVSPIKTSAAVHSEKAISNSEPQASNQNNSEEQQSQQETGGGNNNNDTRNNNGSNNSNNAAPVAPTGNYGVMMFMRPGGGGFAPAAAMPMMQAQQQGAPAAAGAAPYYYNMNNNSNNNPQYSQEMIHKNSQTGSVYTDMSNWADPDPATLRNRGGVTMPFPIKVHRMLDFAQEHGLTHVVGWRPHGRAFAIFNPIQFSEVVMPHFFKEQSKFASFQRQLNLYGFRRIIQGPDSGAYYHERFLRGRPNLSLTMRRTKIKGTALSKTNNGSSVGREIHRSNGPDYEPNLYAFPPISLNPAFPYPGHAPVVPPPPMASLPGMNILPYPESHYSKNGGGLVVGGSGSDDHDDGDHENPEDSAKQAQEQQERRMMAQQRQMSTVPMLYHQPLPLYNVVGPYTMAQHSEEPASPFQQNEEASNQQQQKENATITTTTENGNSASLRKKSNQQVPPIAPPVKGLVYTMASTTPTAPGVPAKGSTTATTSSPQALTQEQPPYPNDEEEGDETRQQPSVSPTKATSSPNNHHRRSTRLKT